MDKDEASLKLPPLEVSVVCSTTGVHLDLESELCRVLSAAIAGTASTGIPSQPPHDTHVKRTNPTPTATMAASCAAPAMAARVAPTSARKVGGSRKTAASVGHQFSGNTTRSLKLRATTTRKVKAFAARADKVVGIDLGTTNSAVSKQT